MVAFLSLPFVLNAFILCNSIGAAVALIGAAVYSIIVVADNKMRRGLILILFAFTPLLIYLADDAFVARISSLLGFESALENQSEASQRV